MIITKEQRAELKTDAQVFEWVKAHAREQGCKASVDSLEGNSPNCMYRTPQGLSCFVGCLITNEEYRENFEGVSSAGLIKTINTLDERSLEDLSKFIDTFKELLLKLQNVHDSCPVEEWEERFAELVY